MARRLKTTSCFIFNLGADERWVAALRIDHRHLARMEIICEASGHVFLEGWPCLIQCERALPSDCQKDAVSPFVIL